MQKRKCLEKEARGLRWKPSCVSFFLTEFFPWPKTGRERVSEREREGERERERERDWGSERDGGVRFSGPFKSVALCFMKGVKKDIKSQHFPPGKGISQHTHTHTDSHRHRHTYTLAVRPPASYYKAEWRGGMAAFVFV